MNSTTKDGVGVKVVNVGNARGEATGTVTTRRAGWRPGVKADTAAPDRMVTMASRVLMCGKKL